VSNSIARDNAILEVAPVQESGEGSERERGLLGSIAHSVDDRYAGVHKGTRNRLRGR